MWDVRDSGEGLEQTRGRAKNEVEKRRGGDERIRGELRTAGFEETDQRSLGKVLGLAGQGAKGETSRNTPGGASGKEPGRGNKKRQKRLRKETSPGGRACSRGIRCAENLHFPAFILS